MALQLVAQVMPVVDSRFVRHPTGQSWDARPVCSASVATTPGNRRVVGATSLGIGGECVFPRFGKVRDTNGFQRQALSLAPHFTFAASCGTLPPRWLVVSAQTDPGTLHFTRNLNVPVPPDRVLDGMNRVPEPRRMRGGSRWTIALVNTITDHPERVHPKNPCIE